MRYVDQIRLKDLSRLPSFIRPEVLGISSVPITPGELIHSFTQSLIRLHDHEVALRWGIIPAGVNFDPTFPATTETSWVLDIDVYTTKKTDFDVDTIVNLERTFADTAYRLFRWSTTKELIEWAGGSLHG